jgi:hypothetical protein
MIELALDFAIGIIIFIVFMFTAESTYMVSAKKRRQQERKKKYERISNR